MGLFSSSSSKNTTNQTQSLSGQSQTGSVYNAAGDLTLLDDGAVRSAIALADKVTGQAAGNSDNVTALADQAIKANGILSEQNNDNATALSAEALRIAEKSASESRDALLKLQMQQAQERDAAAKRAQEIAMQQAQERAAAAAQQAAAAKQQTEALQSANKLQAQTSQHAIEQNTALSKSAINDLRIFANEALEEVADYGGNALEAVQKTSSESAKFANEMSKTAITQVSENAMANQKQMNSVLTNVLTQGQAGLQESASKSMIWIVSLAAVGILGIAVIGRK
ncbi:hypothetical protein [Marinomonas fungiae]|uniref:hypothetical protein n=1 Tax=Marinomonas fungiae TaxID=1137284 RepID=UPI003A900817